MIKKVIYNDLNIRQTLTTMNILPQIGTGQYIADPTFLLAVY